MLLLMGTLFINRFVKGVFQVERRIVQTSSHPVATFLEYTPPSVPLGAVQNDSEDEINTEDRQENKNRRP